MPSVTGSNGWTGGQYSLYRVIFGTYLFFHFAQLIPWGAELFSDAGVLPDPDASPLTHLIPNVLALWDSPALVTCMLAGATAFALLFSIGIADRAAAIAMWYVLACVFGRNPLIANPSLPFVGWLLLAHVFLPRAPYGSWIARGRSDPGGGWRMPQPIFVVAWIVMAVGYSYSGYTKLVSPSWIDGTALAHVMENPLARPGPFRDLFLMLPEVLQRLSTWSVLALELGFAPLALFRPLRRWIWGVMVAMHLGLLTIIDFADLSLGMVVLHLFTFNPTWVRPRGARDPEMLFYDGQCGLCHGTVRFVLAEDEEGQGFRFAPLQSEAFRRVVPEESRPGLPDSLVLRTTEGSLLVRSAAVLRILERLGGVWRVLAGLARLIPARARDAVYNGIARVRHHLFKQPAQICPLVPPALQERFEA